MTQTYVNKQPPYLIGIMLVIKNDVSFITPAF